MARPCAWERCDRPGVLAVLVGAEPGGAQERGVFCVPHAALAGGNAREAQPLPVWLDLADTPSHGRAVVLAGRARTDGDPAVSS